MKIYLDFDGTMVEHDYPEMGRCNFGSIEVIKKLQDTGHEIILNTYRADLNNGTLEKAQELLNKDYWMILANPLHRDIFEMKPINDFCTKKINPDSWDWDRMKKQQVMFIDDIAYGIPLKKAVMTSGNMVDWDELDRQFLENSIY